MFFFSFRLGGILSPYFAQLGDYVPNLHFIMFGVMALTAGIADLNLPETLGQPLPEDMQDLLELLGDDGKRGGSKTAAQVKRESLADNKQYSILSLQDSSDSG